MYLLHGSLRYVGERDFYWSRTASTDTRYAYRLVIDNTNTYSSERDNRWRSLSVRCVASVRLFSDVFSKNTATSPWYYTRAGLIALDIGSVRVAGRDSYDWSSTASTDDRYAYRFHFYDAFTTPSFSSWRRFGLSVRGVASRNHRHFSLV